MNRRTIFFSIFICACLILVVFNSDSTVLAKKSEEPTDYYELFGLNRRAFDKGALKKSYYKLAKQYHPDKNPGDKSAEEQFKKITHAFEVLNDDEKRQVYDVHGEEGLRGGFQSDSEFNPQDIFER